MIMKRLAIFDLDGTLLNTIADLAQSTNYALRINNFAEHDTEQYKYFVGNGINKLFERALPEGKKTEENISRIRKDFLEFYDKHNCDMTKPYDGITDVLKTLQDHKIMLAVASNKYDSATQKLIKHYFKNIIFAEVCGNKENTPTKPDPQIVNNILNRTKCGKEDVLFIGDSNVDMQTAQNAEIDACGVSWGFRPLDELLAYSPKYIAKEPKDILKYILE